MSSLLKYIFLIHVTLLMSKSPFAQLSEQAQVSLITCAEGEEIYALFGHSAIRINDPVNGIDNCYNWGMFEFDSDEIVFATKFTKGRLKYYMAEQDFQYFMFEYEMSNRTVKEQVLNLTYKQKLELLEAINENYLLENRFYKYDFFFDNCSSRIRDILQKVTGENLQLKSHKNENEYSLRELLNNSVSHMPWLTFGMDLALGSKVDIKADNNHMMFLPIYIYEIFKDADIQMNGKTQPFVIAERTLIDGVEHKPEASFWTSPSFLFWTLFVLTMVLTVAKVPYLTKIWDGLLLFVFGLLGVLILFLWFGTDHETMRPNFNILWTHPIYLLFIIPLFSKKIHQKLNKVYLVQAIILFAVIIGAMVIPQEFNTATTPIILLLAFKFFYWYKETKNG